MALRRKPFVLALLATLAGVAGVLWYAAERRESSTLQVVPSSGLFAGIPRGVPGPGEPHGRFYLSEAELRRMFAVIEGIHDLDPFTYYRYRGGLDSEMELDEHRDGMFVHRTSQDGYREDFEWLPAERDLFVLVTGDSNTDGLCHNSESFANVTERELAARRPAAKVEVLNAGVSGYSFYNYVGALERALELRPDAFVMAVYAGNDFNEALAPWRRFHGVEQPPRSPQYWERLNRASRRGELQGNGFHALLTFQEHPEWVEQADLAASEAVGAALDLCREHGIAFVLVLIPLDLEHNRAQRDELQAGLRAAAIDPAVFRTLDGLCDRLVARVRAAGGAVIDLRETFGKDLDRYYWRDLHINVAGHAAIAGRLTVELERLLPPPPK
jgi:lysophospholipase L1-like esterase